MPGTRIHRLQKLGSTPTKDHGDQVGVCSELEIKPAIASLLPRFVGICAGHGQGFGEWLLDNTRPQGICGISAPEPRLLVSGGGDQGLGGGSVLLVGSCDVPVEACTC